MSQTLEEVQSFKAGLSKGGVLEALKRDPKALEYLTYSESLVTATNLIQLFSPQYSDDRAAQELESTIFSSWIHFIEEIEAGDGTEVVCKKIEDISNTDDAAAAAAVGVKVQLSLADVLQFCSGLRFITHAEPISVTFIAAERASNRSMKGDTCHHKLVFPVSERYTEEGDFSRNVSEDICNSPHFGSV